MGDGDKVFVSVALITGIFVGANWSKLRKGVLPIISTVTNQASNLSGRIIKVMAAQKERIEDYVAAARYRKKRGSDVKIG